MCFKSLHNRISKEENIPRLLKLPILLVSSFIFQGIGYMDALERYFKILSTITFSGVAFSVLGRLMNWQRAIFMSLVIGHLANWILNGQIPVVLKNVNMLHVPPKEFNSWIKRIERRSANNNAIAGVAAYGSLSRNELSETSDLDIRVVRRKGLMNGILSVLLVSQLRFEALVSVFPLDIYVVDRVESLDRLNDHEDGIVLLDEEDIFEDN